MTTALSAELVQFAARRSERLNDFDDEIYPIIEKSLANFGPGEWYSDIVVGASVLWLEIFEQHADGGDPVGSIDTFQRILSESLAKTSQPSNPPTEGEVQRVSNWVGVFTVNYATYRAGVVSGSMEKTWITMHDDRVRSMHSAVDGQTVPIRGTFSVGEYKLLFPGEPEGPPEVWINCRCLVAVSGGSQMGTKTTSFAVDATEEDVELTDEQIESEDLVDDITEVPWHGVLTIEGVATGDGRKLAVGSTTFPEPQYMPAPLMYQEYTDGVPHGQSVRVGRIDEMWREGTEIRAKGAFNPNVMEANKAIDGIVFGGGAGISVDLDSTQFELEWPTGEDGKEVDPFEAASSGVEPVTLVTASRVRGATMVGFGAFIEGWLALGPDFDEETRDPEAVDDDAAPGEDVVVDETEEDEEFEVVAEWSFETLEDMIAWLKEPDEGMEGLDERYSLVASAFAPGTHDGPGWITHPRATQRLRSYWVHGKGAAKIRWGQPGDFNRCRMQLAKYVNPAFLAGTCANLHKEAIKVWPGRERGHKSSLPVPAFALVASAAVEEVVDSAYFADPEFDELTAFQIDADGRIYGHLAGFGTCHIGVANACVLAPRSAAQYAYFRSGIIETTDGPLPVGQITLGTGHASERAGMVAAKTHYDHTGYAVADVAVGEDKFGIWFSGKLRDDVDAKDIKDLKAASVSGDWRERNGNLELVGILGVNIAGFPVPRIRFAMDGETQLSLVAAGVLMHKEQTLVAAGYSAEDLHAIGRVVADELEYRAERRERVASVRDPELAELATSRRAARVAAAKSIDE